MDIGVTAVYVIARHRFVDREHVQLTSTKVRKTVAGRRRHSKKNDQLKIF
jgi:hypothetical protein